MKILVLNRGSSSLKTAFFENLTSPSDENFDPFTKIFQSVDVIGHRIVHGGKNFHKSVRITPVIKKELASLSKLAPLHNKQEVSDIEKCEKLYPNIPQIAVFDTAFHHTLPEKAYIYPLPYKYYEEGIRKFGFHGLSFSYCAKKAAELLGSMPAKMVICHLGAGSSLCAVKDGKSIDTTMGFTPLDGVMMDTRSGTIDPGILLHLLEHSTPEELSKTLYHKSGILGLSGTASNMQELLKENSKRSRLVFDIYIHRLNALIGSMIASLGGIDTIVFTGGIGENCSSITELVQKNFSFINNLKVLTVPTGEALEIAHECYHTSKQ